MSLGGILIDAGSDLQQRRLVAEGVELLRAVQDQIPDEARAAYFYNTGNAFLALSSFERGTGPATHPSLAEAISNLDESLVHDEVPNARTNLANALKGEGRLVEALDEYETVLAAHPNHHQALANRGYALMQMHRWATNHQALLQVALRDHERAIELAADEPQFLRSYQRAAEYVRSRAPTIELAAVAPTHYEAWIWSNRLALNPCPICQLDTPGVFDIYPLSGRLAGGRRRPPAEVVSDLVNTLCQSYGTARWLLYSADASPPAEPEHCVSQAGLATAQFGVRTGLLMTAASSFYTVLNQVAFAMKSYFLLDIAPHDVTLATIWAADASRRRFPVTRSEIRRRLLRPANPGLTALYGLARSMEKGRGRYFPLRDLRHSIEHRIVVATTGEADASSYYRVAALDLLRQSAFSLGRVAKAAVWYFSAAVLHAEHERVRNARRHGQTIILDRGPQIRRT